MTLCCVVTTIHPPNESVRTLSSRIRDCNAKLVIVGDRKGPVEYSLDNVKLLTLADQLETDFSLGRLLPTGHYARKNIGYLWSIANGASCIYETDDDNAPNDRWTPRSVRVDVHPVDEKGWVNVYAFFSEDNIWPRGFPLSHVRDKVSRPAGYVRHVEAPIQQGLVDSSPDVDAVWRLVLDREVSFDKNPSVWLCPGAWCPFNSQSTWWWPEAYALMYLPSHCSFRMTDIWRSFIAQRCLWELDRGLVFHGPEAIQQRNHHDLMRDFHDEIPGYESNAAIVTSLEELSLKSGEEYIGDNVFACYECLVKKGHIPPSELHLVTAWLKDIDAIAMHPVDAETFAERVGHPANVNLQ